MVKVTFNEQEYTLTKNVQTGYYEIELPAPSTGGIYDAEVEFTDILGDTYTETKQIQILTKQVTRVKTENLYMWIFAWRDFAVKDMVELSASQIVEDEETNVASNVTAMKNSGAESGDIVAIKQNGEVVYWGIIDEVQNDSGGNKYTYKLKYITNLFDQDCYLYQVQPSLIRTTGLEDYIAGQIDANFINNADTFVNLPYLKVNMLSHTPKNVDVSNVENSIFNLHTWMTNCTQLYDIQYKFYIDDDGKLNVDIENVAQNKLLIDTSFNNISDYSEVFETQITAKVRVITETRGYYLYLLNNRTTTTDQNNPNRAAGKTDIVYTANYEDAAQAAIDAFKGNSYNHNISFKYDKYIPVGTPIMIKTKNQIYDSYISKVTIDGGKFYQYECGNIRTNFIDKLLKEKK